MASSAATHLARPSPWTGAGILLILCLAAALRWTQPGLVEFKYDEAHITSMALAVANGGEWPLLTGGTTLGIQRPALDVYLLALPLALSGGRVEVAVWWLGALGVLAVALTYTLAWQLGGRFVGLLAALYMAANPWLVLYDRKVWAHIQVFFSVALLLLAWQVVVRQRGRAAFCFPIVAALQGLTHVLAALQALSWLGGAVVAPRRWQRRETALGLLVASGLLAPYLWAVGGQLAARSQGAADLATFMSLAPASSGTESLTGAASLFSGNGVNDLAALPLAYSAWWQIGAAMSIPLILVMGLGLARTLHQARGGAQSDGARLLLAWTIGPLLVLGARPIPVFLQYWTVLLPLPALYLALGLDGLARRLGRLLPPRLVWGIPASLALAVSLVWVGSYLTVLDAVGAGAGGVAFGVPLRRWQGALAVSRTWAASLATQEVRVAVNGVDPGHDSEPAVVALLMGNPPWARFVAPTTPAALLLSYDRPSLYLWTLPGPEANHPLVRFGEPVWEGMLTQDRAPARLYRLPPAQAIDLGITRLRPEPVFDVGLALVGYAFPLDAQAGRPFQATLVWRVLNHSPAALTRDFTAFNHILDATLERVAQQDGLALLSRDWWPDDVLLQPYVITLPAGTYRWRVGLYSRQDGARSQVSTGGDFLDLGPLIVK